ncbi:hypothetical protein BDN72DRAFT_900068 [Pluteus cervinus]|uniref:Uncharacterized protein n=1 Tax=Pluteus cervinus TaxID=181527 RepID=A0ACD3AMJ9_9AGAR|nr:hypothetical protein BDN72DRAFT_900068 [Pluteus cervinus]
MSSKCFPQNNDYAEERALIDTKIAALLREIHALRVQRNRLAPISRLPPEIITTIFSFFQTGRTNTDGHTYYEWTVVLQVASEWRKTALNSPSLWTYMVQQGSQRPSPWAGMSLSRSGAAPLDVTISEIGSDSRGMDFVLSILSQMHRIRTLKIHLTCPPEAPNWDGLKTSLENTAAPLIEELSVKGDMSSLVMSTTPSSYPPFYLFGGNTPNLHRLSVWDFPIDFSRSTSSFRHLTHLELTSCWVTQFPGLIDLLYVTQQLQNLHVDDRDPTVQDMPLHSHQLGRTVSLPHLQTLSLSAQWSIAIAFFSILSVPSQTTISVVAVPINQGHTWGDLFRPISRCFSDGVLPLVRMGALLEEYWTSPAVLTLWNTSNLMVPALSFKFNRPDPMICAQAFQVFSLDDLVSLSLRSAQPVGWAFWHISGFTLPASLVVLLVGGPFIGWLLEYIQRHPNCLPNLDTLCILFSQESSGGIQVVLQKLQLVLALWRTSLGGMKLKELELDGCSWIQDACPGPLAAMAEFVDVISIVPEEPDS